MMIMLAVSTPLAEGATRRQPAQSAQSPAQAQPGMGDNMTPEEENALMDAAKTMRKSGLVQFNFKDMDLVRFMRFRDIGGEYPCAAKHKQQDNDNLASSCNCEGEP